MNTAPVRRGAWGPELTNAGHLCVRTNRLALMSQPIPCCPFYGQHGVWLGVRFVWLRQV